MILIPLVAIGVSRDRKSFTPTIGKPFDFSEEEKADLDRLGAEANTEYYRLPVNETTQVAAVAATDVVDAAADEQVDAAAAPATVAKTAGGKKSAAKTTSDETL